MLRSTSLWGLASNASRMSGLSTTAEASSSRLPTIAKRLLSTPPTSSEPAGQSAASAHPPSRKRFHPLSATGLRPYKWVDVGKDQTVARPERIPPAIQPVATPADFLEAISSKPRRDLTSDSSLLGLLGDDWDKMWTLTSSDFKTAGVGVQQRRYVLWAMEKFRQGWKPEDFKIVPKPKKRVRGWGPRVQNGIRVRGVKRPGEKSA
ncbi:unnamed protein product [Parajaminaea phylloscopi]